MTRLDQAHAAMEAAPEDDIRRMRFYERLAESELFVLLENDTPDTPKFFDTEDGPFVLVFDSEDRLTRFTDGPANYAAMSGRAAAGMLDQQGVGLALNLGVASSSFLMPAPAIDWLNRTLNTKPSPETMVPEAIAPPGTMPKQFLTSLDTKLATAEGMASAAYLVAVTYQDGQERHLLAIIDALPDAEAALTQTISEAVIFSGLDKGTLDVAFFAARDPIVGRLANFGLRFDLPKLVVPKPPVLDPTKPPRLR